MLDPNLNIAFIGGGNIARAIITGLIKQGHNRTKILVCAPSAETRNDMVNDFHVRVDKNNAHAVGFADVIILAVKSEMVGAICIELNDAMQECLNYKLVLSMVAGTKHDFIRQLLGDSNRVVCAIPNLPTSICKGLTGLYTSGACDQADIHTAENVMRALGETVWVSDEQQMPAIVATSGSSPAYFYLFMEAMEKAAIEQGLAADVAKTSVLQAALGAISMAIRSDQSLADLRTGITSPKGCTARAVSTFKAGQIDKLVSDAMQSAADRVDELYKNS